MRDHLFVRRAVPLLLALVAAAGCIVEPPADEPWEADRLLTQVRARVMRDNTGTFNSELQFGDVNLVWGGSYWLREARAQLHIKVLSPPPRREGSRTSFEVVLDGPKAYLKKGFQYPNWRWLRGTKRHIFADLQCWPTRDRGLPDRTLMLLFNAEAQGLERDEGRSFIVATVPARLLIGVFPDPRLTELISREGSRLVILRIGHFRGRLTTLELQGRAVKSALERTGAGLDANLARKLDHASYNAWYSELDNPVMLGPPVDGKVVEPGNNTPAPRQFCDPTTI